MPCELILALDSKSPAAAAPLLNELSGTVRWVKIGLEMFTANGPDCVRKIADLGFNIFLDLKLHDIPNTVAKAVESVSRLPIGMLTIHASGGREMMRWAAKAQADNAPDLTLLGVTVLTSTSSGGLAETGVTGTPEQQVSRLGKLAVESGLQGLVCSPLEIASLRNDLSTHVTLVTPGIRLPDSRPDDQSRVMTPGQATAAGADFIVVGRPISTAPNPAVAARRILELCDGAA